MELVSKALRHNFREFCSTITLGKIDEMFQCCDIQLGNLPSDLIVSGMRRTRVEEYYASLDWTEEADAQRFLDVISFALVQEYIPQSYKDTLRQIYNKAGFCIEGDTISFPTNRKKAILSGMPNVRDQEEHGTSASYYPGKYSMKNSGTTQGQVVGEHVYVNMHFGSSQTEHEPPLRSSGNNNDHSQISDCPPDNSSKQIVQQEVSITVLTRRDVIDQLCGRIIEGRLDLIEFLKMTWPDLDSMTSPGSRASLGDDICRHMINFHDWEYDTLLYHYLKILECDDEIFTTFLASCIHPLVLTDKKDIAELLSHFNEALRPDGYVFKIASYLSGKPIYKAFKFNSDESEHIVSRAIQTIEQLARGFHLVVRRLSQRYNHRPSIEIGDEYDVQDLFYAMLTPFFDDIDPEEVTPSYAGGHGRIDFLIKAEQIAIEIKKTRSTLKTRELRDQLIVDKEIYRTHPHYRNFIAFVYDPDGYINNPKGFERDLSDSTNELYVKVIVAPH